jgi:hypothetical protein
MEKLLNNLYECRKYFIKKVDSPIDVDHLVVEIHEKENVLRDK